MNPLQPSPSYLLELLCERGFTIATAESITAGLLASTIASVPGATKVLRAGIVCYHPSVKMALLGVRAETIEQYSAESAQTTTELVEGLQRLFPEFSVYVAITGVASPSSDTYLVNKPVGQIYVSIIVEKVLFLYDVILDSNQRNTIRTLAVEFVIKQLCQLLSFGHKI